MWYTEDHEWISVDGDLGTVGISDYAQQQLGDIVYVDLPELGITVEKGSEVCAVESVKAASEIYAPVTGRIVAVNEKVRNDPALVNSAAEGGAWFFRIRMVDPGELDDLMDQDAYNEYLAELE